VVDGTLKHMGLSAPINLALGIGLLFFNVNPLNVDNTKRNTTDAISCKKEVNNMQ
jgi:hypothetical protein